MELSKYSCCAGMRAADLRRILRRSEPNVLPGQRFLRIWPWRNVQESKSLCALIPMKTGIFRRCLIRGQAIREKFREKIMELKKLKLDFSVCKVKDYLQVN